jgi:hypothetical protein
MLTPHLMQVRLAPRILLSSAMRVRPGVCTFIIWIMPSSATPRLVDQLHLTFSNGNGDEGTSVMGSIRKRE